MKRNSKILLFLTSLLVFTIMSIFGLHFPSAPTVPNSSQSPKPSAHLEITPHEAGPSATQVQGIEGDKALVTKVIDGDTFEVLLNNKTAKVRLVGVDTPETVDPRRPVGCFGKEASNKTKELLTNKEVILQKDVSETDKYHRLLRLVYLPLPDGTILFINDYLVREGFAKVSTYPPDVKFSEQFLAAQKQARENNRGLWAGCTQ